MTTITNPEQAFDILSSVGPFGAYPDSCYLPN